MKLATRLQHFWFRNHPPTWRTIMLVLPTLPRISALCTFDTCGRCWDWAGCNSRTSRCSPATGPRQADPSIHRDVAPCCASCTARTHAGSSCGLSTQWHVGHVQRMSSSSSSSSSAWAIVRWMMRSRLRRSRCSVSSCRAIQSSSPAAPPGDGGSAAGVVPVG
jgi:hypothetical protein